MNNEQKIMSILDLIMERLDKIESRFDNLENRFDRFEIDVNKRFNDLESNMDKQFAEVKRCLADVAEGINATILHSAQDTQVLNKRIDEIEKIAIIALKEASLAKYRNI